MTSPAGSLAFGGAIGRYDCYVVPVSWWFMRCAGTGQTFAGTATTLPSGSPTHCTGETLPLDCAESPSSASQSRLARVGHHEPSCRWTSPAFPKVARTSLDARPVGTEDSAQVGSSQPVLQCPSALCAVGDVAPAADRQQGHPAVRLRDVLRPRGIAVSPMSGGIDRFAPLEPSLGRFLGDEVAVEETGPRQRSVSVHDGTPAHAHCSGDLPGGRCLLELVLAGAIGVDDQIAKREAGWFQRIEYPHAAFLLKFSIFLFRLG